MNDMRLTAKGERWLLAAYRVAVVAAGVGGLLLAFGIAGWIEGS